MMYGKTQRLIEEMDELMKESMAMIDVIEVLESTDDKTLSMVKAYMKLYKESKELMLCQAEMIDEQDKKLDKIIRLLEKK